MQKLRMMAAVTATAALAGGAVMAGAGAAGAANDPGFGKVKAPKTVQAGKTFILKCKLASNFAMPGADAYLLEKGATINAHRTVATNGDCSFHVVLNATGTRKLRVVVEQNLGAIESKWIKVKVQ